ATGDEVLRRVARILAQHVRRTDTAARLGGDEFALLLVGASKIGAEQKANTLRSLIGSACLVPGDPFAVGISIGWAYYSGEESEAELFRRADTAMYGQKAANRHPVRRRSTARPPALVSAA
ncbi:MAG: GGDEF domain-containing protein, partial [Alphaproteobacteria bacterium]|nr:GGDEF domain-containing protein [Alphaproteobacteria bacterium]